MASSRGTPNEHQLAVALTFDFDAESLWLGAFQTDTPSALSRGAYGANEGVPRILRLLEDYQLPATFFVPGDTALRHREVTANIAAAGHEIGHHGFLHEPPTTLSADEERSVIERGIDALVEVTGHAPTGYRSPSWELSHATYQLLEEHGITYDASQLGADRPYWVTDRGRPTSIVELPGAWELTDSAHFMFSYFPAYRVGLAAPSHVEEVWRGDFDGLYAEASDACLVLTMHPQIIGRPHRIAMLRSVIEYMLGHHGVWFCQMRELADAFRLRSANL